MKPGRLSFHDFRITGPADVRTCGNVGGFRAVRRQDDLPVLLHRFRPARTLLCHKPLIETTEPPDFTAAFVTRFTGLIEAGGSAYLVEPLPLCAALNDAWRCMLLYGPEQSVGFVVVFAERILAVLNTLSQRESNHGAICLDNIVLTQAGMYGLLAGHLECEDGWCHFRSAPPYYYSPNSSYAGSPFLMDVAATGQVVQELLEIEAGIVKAQNAEILSPAQRRDIKLVGRSIQLPTIYPPGDRASVANSSCWFPAFSGQSLKEVRL